jgi:hypothetical protein
MESNHTIHAAILTIVAIVVASMCSIPGKPGGTDDFGIAVSARDETGLLVIAQYNPCPNRVCR